MWLTWLPMMTVARATKHAWVVSLLVGTKAGG
jgi:hypothetical protein